MDTKIFAKTIEQEAQLQIDNLSNSDAYKGCKIRVMPDVHAGNGCTVGTTIKLNGKVCPNTVGVDICCGMLVYELGNIDIDLKKLDEVINTYIPSGFNIHNEAVVNYTNILKSLNCIECIDIDMANRSIGTLGGGNHFIELNIDDDNNKYLVIHSGSRNLGVRVCNYYQKLAINKLTDNSVQTKSIIEQLKSQGRQREISNVLKSMPKSNIDKDLAYLQGKDLEKYMFDMRIVQSYARNNRLTIGYIILNHIGIEVEIAPYFETLHNYIDIGTMTLRKGAVRANKGEKLIIPMNMRDGSLICIGKGNEDWNNSAPHGAGRLMSRNKAKDTLSLADYMKSMRGIYSSSVCENTIDEAPMAYKPMNEIIDCIKETVDIVKIIKPIYNFKAK